MPATLALLALLARALLLAPRLLLVAAAVPALALLTGLLTGLLAGLLAGLLLTRLLLLAGLLTPAALLLARLLSPTTLALTGLLMGLLLRLLLRLAPAALTLLLTGLLSPAALTALTALPGLLPGRTGPPRSLWRRRHVCSFGPCPRPYSGQRRFADEPNSRLGQRTGPNHRSDEAVTSL